MASIYDLLRLLGQKGGPANGRPVVTPGKPQYPTMNLSQDQAAAPHTLSATLASHGPKAESSLKAHLTAQQAQRRAARDRALQAGGFAPGTSVYGPNANPEALAFLKGGTGLGRGIGLAQGAVPTQPQFSAREEAPDVAASSLLSMLGRRDRRARRRGYNVS